MLLNNISPQPGLAEFVRCYRIIHFNFEHKDMMSPPVKAYRPRIEHCLQFTPFDAEWVHYSGKKSTPLSYKVALFGQHTVLNNRHVGNNYLNFQVVFQPGFLCRLMKWQAAELTNLYVDAGDHLGREVQLVNEQLASAKDYPRMIEAVETYLLKLVRKTKPREHPCDRIARQMVNPAERHTMAWYANQANLCFRQFDRMFKARTGITPKEYTSLVRLDLAYLLKNRFPEKDWLSIAWESGFYDYQHLSREYARFTGHSPVAFFELEKQAPERFFGDYEQ